MIAKAKAIAHGKIAIEYAMRELKNGELVASNLIQNNTPDKIYQEYLDIQKYNTRCKNKFIRFEIGIAPSDEDKLSQHDLRLICNQFSKRLGFENHQWIACTHRDTDNLHIHMIVNRIGIDQSVYDTGFISNRASNIAEKISEELGLTIANKVRAKQKHHNDISSVERILARSRIEKVARNSLTNNPKSLQDFQLAMKEKEIIVSEVKNRKGNTYGLRFTGYNETFKASAIGEDFGYRTLLQTFKSNTEAEINEYNNTQSKLSSSQMLSGLGSILSYLSDDEHSLDEEDEQENSKRSKNRRYGR